LKIKNIAIVIDSLVGGGAERVMISLASALISQQHSVTLLSLSNRIEYTIPAAIKVCCLFDHKAKKVDSLWSSNKSVARLEAWFFQQEKQYGQFDLVLSNLDRSNNLLAKSRIESVFFVIHNSIKEELQRQKKLGPFAYFYLLKSKRNLSNKNLICVSKGIEQEIIDSTLIRPKTLLTIYNPFDLNDIRKRAQEHNTDIPSVPYLIHVGRLAKQKRHDILFKALALVASDVKLVLLCNKPQKALKLAKKYGVANRVVLPGFQENPYNWITQAEVLILSSDYEGFGNVLLEAITVNTKVVSTDCRHGPNEILTGQLAAFLAPRREPEKLAKCINKALTVNVDLKNADILTKVSAEKIVQQYLLLAK
jgi:glycosyltransferase involved in cell wall biosynthesis